MKTNLLTVAQILEATNKGLTIFQFILEQSNQKLSVQGERCKSVLNPFYKDTKPSLSIYYNAEKSRWYFKDHGNHEYLGDAIDFASLFYGLDVNTNFKELLEKIESDLKDYKPSTVNHVEYSKKEKNTKNRFFMLHETDFTEEALKYYLQYGITKEMLVNKNVVQLLGYSSEDGTGKTFTTDANKDQLIFAFKQQWGAKIYSPFPKGFRYVGNKPSNYVFENQLVGDWGNGEYVILTGGEKDVLTLGALGVPAICLGSETVKVTSELIIEYYHRGYQIKVMLDCDTTGIKMMEQAQAEFNLKTINLGTIVPVALNEKVTDVSDYISNGLSVETLIKLLDLNPETEPTDFDDSQNQQNDYEVNSDKTNMGVIPLNIYENLPETLKEITDLFSDKKDKDLSLLSTLVLLGVLFDNVSGLYGDNRYYPAFFLFVVAKASAGKNTIKWVEAIGEPFEEMFHEEFHLALNKWSSLPKKDREEKPKKKSNFISGNASSQSLIAKLATNNGAGLIFETEADVIVDTAKNDWGNYSTILRKCFEQETISSDRVSEENSYRMTKTNVGVLISGTPNQLLKLIPSAENGLLSRFVFYQFESNLTWKNQFSRKSDLKPIFHGFGNRIKSYWEMIKENGEIRFCFTEEQEQKSTEYFASWQNKFIGLVDEDSVMMVRRMAVVHFRISMILKTLRHFDLTKKWNRQIICCDSDFETESFITDCLLVNSMSVYNQLPKHSVKGMKIKKMNKGFMKA